MDDELTRKIEDQQAEHLREADSWRRSQERRRGIIIVVLMCSLVLLLVSALFVVAFYPGDKAGWWRLVWSIVALTVLGALAWLTLLASINLYHSAKQKYENRILLERVKARNATLMADALDPQEGPLAQLWKNTNDLLAGYHERATRQADQSFRNAQIAIAGGFAIIAGTAAIAAWKTTLTTSSSIVIGAIGTVGAGLAAYIGRTFLRLQETTATHMRSYFDQPQETFRYLVAERLIDRIPEDQRAQTIEYLVQAVMLSGLPVEQVMAALNPPPQAPGGAGGSGP